MSIRGLQQLRALVVRRHLIPLALVAIGVVTLAYVGFQYGTMYHEQKRLAQQWEEQQKLIASNPHEQPVQDGLTRLSIPKINLAAVVVDGTSRKDLLIGPGRIKETALPGETGNAVITGHRDTFFRHIYELNKGDVIEVTRNGKTFRYEVTGKRVVDPADLSVIKQTPDSQLTLITCYPTYFIGPAPERLVVSSKLIDSAAAGSLARTSASGTP